MIRIRVAILAAATYALTIAACSAMDISFLSGADDGGPGLLLQGEIKPGDTARIVPILIDLYRRGQTPRLVLDSPGGNILDADKLALVIRKASVPVTVPAGRTCASACFLLFAASPDRTASMLASIGVHSASMDGDENLVTLDITTIMARQAAEFGIPADIIGRMVTTRPSDMAWLTTTELREMGVRLLEAPATAQPAQHAPSIGRADDPDLPQPPSAPMAANGGHSIALAYRPADFAAACAPGQGTADACSSAFPTLLHGRHLPDYSIIGGLPVMAPSYRPGY